MWKQISQLSDLDLPDTVHAERTLVIIDGLWLANGADAYATTAVVRFSADDYGGTVTIGGPDRDGAPEVALSGHEFLAVCRFLVEEGLLQACGLEDEASQDPTPPPATAGYPSEPGVPPELLDPALLDDPEWLMEKYQGEGLSMQAIGQLVGRSYQTVRKRLLKHQIPIRPAGYQNGPSTS